MTEQELDDILTFRWPGVLRRVMGDLNAGDFSKGFARSIAAHGKRPTWRPTPKQVRIMREMLDQYTGSAEPEPELIERG